MTTLSQPDTAERRAAALARLGAGPFTAAEALTAGLTRDDLRSRLVTTVMRGVYVDAAARVDHAMRCAAALRVMPPETWVAGFSAAHLLGLPVPGHDGIHLSLPRGVECRRSDVILTRRPPRHRCVPVRLAAGTLPVTSPVDLVVEMADALAHVDAVVLADAVLRRVGGRAVDARWRESSARMNRVSEHAHPGAESPMETRLRLLLVLAGFEGVAVQHEVMIAGRRRRFDLAFPR